MPSSQLQRIAQVFSMHSCDVGFESEPSTRVTAAGIELCSEWRRRIEGRRHRADGLGAISRVHRGDYSREAESGGAAGDSGQILRAAGAIDPGERDFEADREPTGGFDALARNADGNRALGCGVRPENAERREGHRAAGSLHGSLHGAAGSSSSFMHCFLQQTIQSIHPFKLFIHSFIHSFTSISISLTHLYHQQTLQRQYKPHSFFSFFFFLFLLRLSSTQTQPTPERIHHRQRRNGSQNRVLRLPITPNNTHSTQNELARRR